MTSIEIALRFVFHVCVVVLAWSVVLEKQHVMLHNNRGTFGDLMQYVCAANCLVYFAIWFVTAIVGIVYKVV